VLFGDAQDFFALLFEEVIDGHESFSISRYSAEISPHLKRR